MRRNDNIIETGFRIAMAAGIILALKAEPSRPSAYTTNDGTNPIKTGQASSDISIENRLPEIRISVSNTNDVTIAQPNP